MKAKPRGRRYRNLTAVGEVIYYEKLRAGKRERFSLKTSDWDQAAVNRDAYEMSRAGDAGRVAIGNAVVPSFAEMAALYLRDGTHELAATTRLDLGYSLRPDLRLVIYFGECGLDEIGEAELSVYWSKQLTTRKPSAIKNDIAALSAVFRFAAAWCRKRPAFAALELVKHNPVHAFKRELAENRGTKKSRQESDPARMIRPIRHADQIERLLEASRTEELAVQVVVLLGLDAGLRWGECMGLRWGDIEWGANADDTRRKLVITVNRPRSGAPEATKSGRAREVELSRRLRAALHQLYRQAIHRDPESNVLPTWPPDVFRVNQWRRILHSARIGDRRFKDLRDTFASQLLTCGVQLGYVSKQLGHADVAVTARHYATWASGDAYRDPFVRQKGEVPADFLARLAGSPESPPTALSVPDEAGLLSLRNRLASRASAAVAGTLQDQKACASDEDE